MKVAIEIADGEIVSVQGDTEGELVVIDQDWDEPRVSRFPIRLGDVEELARKL